MNTNTKSDWYLFTRKQIRHWIIMHRMRGKKEREIIIFFVLFFITPTFDRPEYMRVLIQNNDIELKKKYCF